MTSRHDQDAGPFEERAEAFSWSHPEILVRGSGSDSGSERSIRAGIFRAPSPEPEPRLCYSEPPDMWFGRRRRLLEIRRAWAKPVARERRLETIAASHAERCAALGTQALDARAWADLDLDDVFVAIDRTTSTLGQHALYHRLRTAPVGDHLDEFETLVERMRGDDATTRERAQLALSRLQDPQGYDVWWLGAADSLERQPWYSLFPVLTAITVALAVAALFWTAAIVPLVAMVAVNMAVRYATDERTIAIARSFRQLAPLIATAESLRFLDDSAHASITGPLRADVPSLARLKLISRWVNGNPFMLSFNSNGLALARRRSRRDRLRVPEHCLPAGCDRRSRRPEGSGGAPARAATRRGGDRRS